MRELRFINETDLNAKNDPVVLKVAVQSETASHT